ncbi:glycoside hydrolase family 85 protein [Mycena floridula]|nr:glycoside hydrolase family 85 protein [Mycena floridula]
MPLAGNSQLDNTGAYFDTLEELDNWASKPSARLENVLSFKPRTVTQQKSCGKLLVCHDYKGGYTESPFSLCYTFNFWSYCETFVYFSHRRVTIPPPGWITAAHRQGVKMLGTLIFEGGAEADCLRLLVGKLPKSTTGPAAQPSVQTALPLSAHYARVLADLARQRGFDGYLLNFECPLQGGVEQTRALAAWITILQTELRERVGSYAEVSWYDSVIVDGRLRWQDRLNSLNLPFFLSSSSLFTNYTWRNDYPALTAEYFLSLDPSITGNQGSSTHVASKSLQDIYMGIDVWGRGSHGNGGFGSYKALSHIAPESLGLSVALFGQAWTWESEQDKPGWTWESWWEYESRLWVGPVSGEVHVPEAPKREGEPDCTHGPFQPISSFFPRQSPPDPYDVPFHTTFSPGVGRAWWVNGQEKYRSRIGWTDIDKQTSVGDLVWPKAAIAWEGDVPEGVPLLQVASRICMEDAWNGGSSLELTILDPGTQADNAALRCVWIPIQSLTVTAGRPYEAVVVFKVDPVLHENLDISISMKSLDGSTNITAAPTSFNDTSLPNGWSKLAVQLSTSKTTSIAVGLVIAVVSEDATEPLSIPILVGQLNVYPSRPQSSPVDSAILLWADFAPKDRTKTSGILTWETAASFPVLRTLNITTPDDPKLAWALQPADLWFPVVMYANIYVLVISPGVVAKPEDAVWIGTSGYSGLKQTFVLDAGTLPFGADTIGSNRLRFYVQGVIDRGEVLEWNKCVFVEM